MSKRIRTKVVYVENRINPIEQLNKHINWVREKEDHFALAYALEEIEDIDSNIKKFETLRNSPIYKKVLRKALKRFRQLVKEEGNVLRKYGEHNSEHYVDKDFYLSNKHRLELLEKEAKRLKIKA